MELREWQYMNKPTTNTASASTSSNTGFKKRLERLIKYHGDNLPVDVDYLMVGLLTKDKLEFAEQYDDGHVEEYKISIDPSTEAWKVEIFINRQPDENFSGTGWPELLKSLRPCIVVPETRELEYKNLLTEWVVMNNKTPSTGYKKRFEKLIKYHIDHASSELERIVRKDIKDDSFHLTEHYNNGHHEFDRDIVVSYDKDSDTFMLRIFVDGKTVDNILCNGYEDFVIAAEGYMFLPDYNTLEYADLLTESLTEWKYMNPPTKGSSQPVSNPNKNKDKFYDLISYMQKHKYSIVTSTKVDRLDNTGFEYEEHREPTKAVAYDLRVEVDLVRHDLFTIHVFQDGKQTATYMPKGWENFLLYLKSLFNVPATGSPEHTALIESELTEWHLMNPPKTTPNNWQKYRYERLLAQIDADSIATYTVNTLNDTTLNITVNTKKKNDLNIKIIYDPADDDYTMITNGSSTLEGCDYEKDILPLLIAGGVINNTDLCESYTIADDFKLYENLWN